MLVLACGVVGGLCVGGINFGSLKIETNTDSFLDSDSQASLDYNAFLQAIDDNKKADSRRLHFGDLESTSVPIAQRGQDYWHDIYEAARRPTFDDRGWFYPWRYLARQIVSVVGPQHRNCSLASGDGKGRRLSSLYKKFALSFIYATNKKKPEDPETSILTSAYLQKVRAIEDKLRAIPEWHSLCHNADPAFSRFCEEGVSFRNYAYPHKDEGDGDTSYLHFNGSGSFPYPLDLAVKEARRLGALAQVFPDEVANAATYVTEGHPCSDAGGNCQEYAKDGQCLANATYAVYMRDFCRRTCKFCGAEPAYDSSSTGVAKVMVSNIRSSFVWPAYCCESGPGQVDGKEALETKWSTFVETVVEMLKAEQKSDGPMRIFYFGDGVETYEAMAARK
jgi:hypothetical protein